MGVGVRLLFIDPFQLPAKRLGAESTPHFSSLNDSETWFCLWSLLYS